MSPNGPCFLPQPTLHAPPTTSIISAVRATARGTVGLVTSAGRLIKLNVLELPAMPPGAGAVSLAGGTPVTRVRVVRPGRDGGRAGGRGRRSRRRCWRRCWRRAGPGDGGGRGQAGAARLPAEPGRVRADLFAGRRPGGWRGAAVRRVGRAGVHHLRRAAAAVRGRLGPAAGPGGRRHGRRAAVFWRVRRVVRRGGCLLGVGHAVGAAGELLPRRGGHRGGQRGRPARHRGRQREGHPAARVPRQGPGHRRGALPAVPQGRGHAGHGVGRAGPGGGRDRIGRSGPAAGPGRASGTARASRSAVRWPSSAARSGWPSRAV